MKKKIHFGPGFAWKKPSEDWISIDVDPDRADVLVNFNRIEKLPFEDNVIQCIYGSHIFEHIDIFHTPIVFKECFRILCKGGAIRIVIPDVRKSIEHYFNGNNEFPLFQRRRESLEKLLGVEDVSLFELLKCDFISPSGQPDLLGQKTLAHQNAWDFEAMRVELVRAGFNKSNVKRKEFQISDYDFFNFEGTYPSEANEFERSLYIEASK